MTMQETPAKKSKAKLIGIIVGIVVFLMGMVYVTLNPNYADPAAPGSGTVTVRRIRKDDGVKRAMYVIAFAAAAGYLTTRHLRQKEDNKNTKA